MLLSAANPERWITAVDGSTVQCCRRRVPICATLAPARWDGTSPRCAQPSNHIYLFENALQRRPRLTLAWRKVA